jgi:hypothetical protein
MKNKIGCIVGLLIVISLLLTFITPKIIYRIKEENLAKELGIANEDYLNKYVKFPYGYYKSIIPIGTPIETVHNTIIGYEKVYHCYNISEVYYFFSENDDKAQRMEIIYDQVMYVKDIRSEDSNSRTIAVSFCEEGIIK